MPLAIDSYHEVTALADSAEVLNLSWTLDEREFLSVDVHTLVTGCLAQEIDTQLQWTAQYMVKDPYGALALGPAVESFFGTSGLAPHVTCAAGVNALLHALAGGWAGGTALLPVGVYPDFPHWLRRVGTPIVALPRDVDLPQWQAALCSGGVAVVFIERPAFMGAPCDGLEHLRALCCAAEGAGAAVLIDESNANYLSLSDSAAPLTREIPNLAVLRGFSKAYGLGGIRVGFCVSSAALTPRIRAAVPPLQASSLSLLVARALLEAGDIAAPLRQRIAAMKRHAAALLDAAGLATLPCAQSLPYMLLADAAALERDGTVAAKRHPLWAGAGKPEYVHRCSVPLRPQRMTLFQNRLASIARRGFFSPHQYQGNHRA